MGPWQRWMRKMGPILTKHFHLIFPFLYDKWGVKMHKWFYMHVGKVSFRLHRVLLKANRFKWSSTQFFNLIDWTLCAAAYATCRKVLLQYIVKSSIHWVWIKRYSHIHLYDFWKKWLLKEFSRAIDFSLKLGILKRIFQTMKIGFFVSFLC